MPRVSSETELTGVEYILGSGTGILDFAIEGKDAYYTWEGTEDEKWTVENVQRVENDDEDRFIMYPEDDCFTCEITLGENNEEIVYCE